MAESDLKVLARVKIKTGVDILLGSRVFGHIEICRNMVAIGVGYLIEGSNMCHEYMSIFGKSEEVKGLLAIVEIALEQAIIGSKPDGQMSEIALGVVRRKI